MMQTWRVALLISVGLFVLGCAVYPPAPPPPRLATVTTAPPPDRMYQLAYKSFASQPGWAIQHADSQMRSFRGLVNNAAQMTVLVEANGKGSLVTVHGQVLPNKVVVGEFTEFDAYVQMLKEAK